MLSDTEMLEIALEEARAGADEGGIPIGAALFLDGACIARGRNQRVQQGSQILHGEMSCLANAGDAAAISTVPCSRPRSRPA